jgi:hypothetical protein
MTYSCCCCCIADFLANEKGLKREEVKSWTPYPGGAPANVATALTKLGVPTALVSSLGNDERGEELMALLNGACQWCYVVTNMLRMLLVTRCFRHVVDWCCTPVYHTGMRLAHLIPYVIIIIIIVIIILVSHTFRHRQPRLTLWGGGK